MKCKLCGTRLAEGATKCPVCGASVSENGEATSAPVMENINLPTYKCPSCKADIVGEHRFCPSCGVNLQQAAQEYETKATADKDETAQKKSFCPQCGAEVRGGAKFCNECGAKLVTDTSHEEPAKSVEENGDSEINSAQVQKPLGKTKSKKKVIIAAVVIFAVLGIIGNLIEENESSSSRGDISYAEKATSNIEPKIVEPTIFNLDACKIVGSSNGVFFGSPIQYNSYNISASDIGNFKRADRIIYQNTTFYNKKDSWDSSNFDFLLPSVQKALNTGNLSVGLSDSCILVYIRESNSNQIEECILGSEQR